MCILYVCMFSFLGCAHVCVCGMLMFNAPTHKCHCLCCSVALPRWVKVLSHQPVAYFCFGFNGNVPMEWQGRTQWGCNSAMVVGGKDMHEMNFLCFANTPLPGATQFGLELQTMGQSALWPWLNPIFPLVPKCVHGCAADYGNFTGWRVGLCLHLVPVAQI